MPLVRLTRQFGAEATLLWVALIACDRASRSPTPGAHPSDSTAQQQAAVAPARYTSVEDIRARVDSIDRYLTAHPERLRVYAKVPDRERLVPVPDSTAWPDEVDASYNILADSAGRVLLHREMPTSQSGDWFAVQSHYFAPDGHTILYRFEISGFSGGCTDILRESRQVYLDPGFAVLQEERSFTDKDGAPVDPTNCYQRSDAAPPARRGVSELPTGEEPRATDSAAATP